MGRAGHIFKEKSCTKKNWQHILTIRESEGSIWEEEKKVQ